MSFIKIKHLIISIVFVNFIYLVIFLLNIWEIFDSSNLMDKISGTYVLTFSFLILVLVFKFLYENYLSEKEAKEKNMIK